MVNAVPHLASAIGSSPRILIYQQDGDLVLYKVSGDSPTAEWSANTGGRKPGRVAMQDDGNFVIYGPDNKVHWALWKEMPRGYEGSYIAIDNINGKLAYHKNGNSKEAFYINDKKDCYLAPQ